MITASYSKSKKKLTLYYEESSYGGQVASGQEGKRYACHEDEFFTQRFLSLCRSKLQNLSHKYYYSKIEIDANFNPTKFARTFLVVVRYKDGCTFGSTYGNCYIEGAYKSIEEAGEVAQKITNGKYKGYKAWESYFGGLEGVEVVPMNID